MARLEKETADLIAPHELRELLIRLTEESTDGLRMGDARTLSGLALQTGVPVGRLRAILKEVRRKRPAHSLAWAVGVVAMSSSLGWFKLIHARDSEPAQELSPPVMENPKLALSPGYDATGTVALNQVSYGPDLGNYGVVPSFSPPAPLPPGISISESLNTLLWGAGDAHAAALSESLSLSQEENLRSDLTALAKYAYQDAARRGVPPTNAGRYEFILNLNSYRADLTSSLELPAPRNGVEPNLGGLIRVEVDHVLAMLKQQMKSTEEARRAEGP